MATDFWCVVDARDVAEAFALGLEVDYAGAHPLFINDSVNCVGRPSRELAGQCYPDVHDWRAPMVADEALISCQRATALLGWAPRYRCRPPG